MPDLLEEEWSDRLDGLTPDPSGGGQYDGPPPPARQLGRPVQYAQPQQAPAPYYPPQQQTWAPEAPQPGPASPYEFQQTAGYPGQPVYPPAPVYQPPVQQFAPPYDPAYQALQQVPPELSEAEKRFARYQYYRQLLGQQYVDTSDPIGAEVQTELTQFIHRRMQALVGTGPDAEPSSGGLSADDVQLLRDFAAQVRERAMAMRQQPQRPQAPPPPPPVRRPPPARPQAPPPPQPPQQRQAPPPQPPAAGGPPNPKVGLPPPDSIVEEGGIKFKIRHVEMFPGEWPEAEEMLRKMPVGRFTTVKGRNIQVLRNGPEEFVKIVKQQLTGQQRGHGGIPFPSMQQMELVSQATADRALQMVQKSPLNKLVNHFATGEE